jgi:hypothetical protein
MNCQSKPAKSFRNNCEHAFGVMLVLKADDEIICIANEEGTTTHARFYILLEPEIQHIMSPCISMLGTESGTEVLQSVTKYRTT